MGKEGPLMTQLVFKGNESLASKLTQRVRGQSPSKQGKKQYIRKINRPEARGDQGQGGLSLLLRLWQRTAVQGSAKAADIMCLPHRRKGVRMNAVLWVLTWGSKPQASPPTSSLSVRGDMGSLLPQWSYLRTAIPGSKALGTSGLKAGTHVLDIAPPSVLQE